MRNVNSDVAGDRIRQTILGGELASGYGWMTGALNTETKYAPDARLAPRGTMLAAGDEAAFINDLRRENVRVPSATRTAAMGKVMESEMLRCNWVHGLRVGSKVPKRGDKNGTDANRQSVRVIREEIHGAFSAEERPGGLGGHGTAHPGDRRNEDSARRWPGGGETARTQGGRGSIPAAEPRGATLDGVVVRAGAKRDSHEPDAGNLGRFSFDRGIQQYTHVCRVESPP